MPCLVSLAENATLYLNSHFLAHHNCILANFYALKCNQGIGNLQNCTGLHPGLPLAGGATHPTPTPSPAVRIKPKPSTRPSDSVPVVLILRNDHWNRRFLN